MSAFTASEVSRHLMDLTIALVLAPPIGWDRERPERSARIRTFPLVAMACCGFVLVGISVLRTASLGHARVPEWGSLVEGAILRQSDRTSVGYRLYDIAIVLAVVMFATSRAGSSFKANVRTFESGVK